MRSPHFWGVTQLSLADTYFSGHPVGSMLEGNISCPGTWVQSYHSAQRNISKKRILLRFTCPWLQYIPLSLTKNLYISHTVFVLPYNSTIYIDYIPEHHNGFVFIIEAHCVLCEVGNQSIPYIIRLVGGVSITEWVRVSECVWVSGWVGECVSEWVSGCWNEVTTFLFAYIQGSNWYDRTVLICVV